MNKKLPCIFHLYGKRPCINMGEEREEEMEIEN
jgi:hypothetical protein